MAMSSWPVGGAGRPVRRVGTGEGFTSVQCGETREAERQRESGVSIYWYVRKVRRGDVPRRDEGDHGRGGPRGGMWGRKALAEGGGWKL